MPLRPEDPEVAAVLDLARQLAADAASIQRERFETGLGIETKSVQIDLVTEVDKACEALIVRGIESQRPGDAILAEEGGGEDTRDAEWRWVVDPLDGTTNFAHGFPRFCVSIAAERRGVRTVGVIVDPLLGECFEAARGSGAWLGDRRLAVSKETQLSKALIATGFAYDVHESKDDNLDAFARVVKRARGIRRDGSAALDLCYVAAGRLDAYWEIKLHPWDVAAGLLLVEEAGGQASDLRGGPVPASGRELTVSNGPLHAALLSAVRG